MSSEAAEVDAKYLTGTWAVRATVGAKMRNAEEELLCNMTVLV
jgi:hypothetical protein